MTMQTITSPPTFTTDVPVSSHIERNFGDDVRRGLSAPQKTLPTKYLYDDRGSELFDAICRTSEYYPTRTELALLEGVAARVVATARPAELVELGSGMARKTHALLDATAAAGRPCRYVPVDISESAALRSAQLLGARYPLLPIHVIVADFEAGLRALPQTPGKLIAFLGSTLGNFDDTEAVEFLSAVREVMGPEDFFLLGTDLVKDEGVLSAAYNDASGVTAEFNLNILSVVNRELGANFQLDSFAHHAFYRADERRIEMHLVSSCDQEIHIDALDWTAHFRAGESIRTEISRKYTEADVRGLFVRAGMELSEWFPSDDNYFALSLARRTLGDS